MVELEVGRYYYVLDYYNQTDNKIALIRLKELQLENDSRIWWYDVIQEYSDYSLRSYMGSNYFYETSSVHLDHLKPCRAYNTPLWKVLNS